jgi:hypothetical protein
MCRPICYLHASICTKSDLQYLFPGWCTSCTWTWCTHNYWQWSLDVRHPASQGVGRGLVSVHRSERCRFHCHTGTALCWDTQRVSPWATAPQPSKTYKGHRTRVSLLCRNTYNISRVLCNGWILFVSLDLIYIQLAWIWRCISQGIQKPLNMESDIGEKLFFLVQY